MIRTIIIQLYIFLLIIVSPQLLHASNINEAKLGVYARILPYLSVASRQETRLIQISRQDIDRGYVEVRSATILDVRSNIKRAYYLSLIGTGDFYEKVLVMDGNRKFILNDNIVQIDQVSAGLTGGEVKAFNYRFYLSSYTIPGSYPWPIRVEVLI